jgi:hypothetical protein
LCGFPPLVAGKLVQGILPKGIDAILEVLFFQGGALSLLTPSGRVLVVEKLIVLGCIIMDSVEKELEQDRDMIAFLIFGSRSPVQKLRDML